MYKFKLIYTTLPVHSSSHGSVTRPRRPHPTPECPEEHRRRACGGSIQPSSSEKLPASARTWQGPITSLLPSGNNV